MATAEKLKAVEKLLSRLSERKRSIIEHVKQQTEAYSQHLASKLLIQGISPPSWLRDPSTSAEKELNEEDLISRLLSQYQEGSARCSIASSPGHSNLIVIGDHDKFRDGDIVEIPAANEDHYQENEPVAPGFSCDNNGECALSLVPKLDHSAASSKDQIDENISNNYTIPDQSLAGIQRSKSRQKALKLRSSAKASGKSGLRHESNGDVVSSQIRFSLSITKQPCQNGDMSQLEEPCIIDNHSSVNRNVVETHSLNREEEVAARSECRSESHAEVPISVVGSSPFGCSSNYYKEKASCQDARVKRKESNPISDTEHPDNHVNLPKSAGPSAVCRESIRGRADEDADFLCEDEGTNVHTGEIIRSDVSSRRQTCGCDSTKAGSSFDDHQGIDITMKDAGDYLPPDRFDGSLMKIHSSNVHSAGLARQVNDSQEQLGLDKPSDEFRSVKRSKTHSYGKETHRPVTYNEGKESIAYCEGNSAEELQSSSVQYIPSYLSTHKMLHDDENGKLVMASELCLPDHVDKSSLSSANYSKQGRGLESEVALTPSDSSASAEPKQLESKQAEEYDLKAFTSTSGKKLNCPLNDPDVPLDKGICGENNPPSRAGSARQVNDSQELLGLVKTSDGFRRVTSSQTHSYGKQMYLPVTYNEGTESISDCEGKSAKELQISSVQSIPPYLSTHKLPHDDENGKLVMASELCLPDHVNKSRLSSSDYSKQGRGLESELALTPSDSFASVEPKQLEVKQTEECDLKAFTSRSGKKLSCSLHDPDVSLDKGIPGGNNQPSSSKQLPRMLDISTQGGKVCRDSFQPDVQESPDTHIGKFGPVIDSVIVNASEVSSEVELNFRSSEVHGEMHDLPSKLVDITDIQILPENLHIKYGPESSPVHSMEQGNFDDEACDKSQLVFSVPESKNSRLSQVQESEKDQAAKSNACLIKKAGTNPIAIDDMKQYPAHQSQILSWPESGVSSKHGDSSLGITSLGRPSMIRLDDKNLSFERRLRHVRTESWPQIKRRKIEHQQDRGCATSKSFRVTKPHTFQWDPDIAYQKTMEIEIDSGLVVNGEKSTDDGLCLEAKANSMEEIQPAMLSHHGEVESCNVEKSENEHTSPDINSELLAATISSLAKKESRNSQGCYIEGTRTSPLTCDDLDASLSGYKQCRQNFCNLENNTDNQSSDIMKLSSTLTEEIQQPPKWEDGLHMQHSVLSSSHEDMQLIDFDQSMPVFEGFIVNAETDTEEMNLPAVGFDLGELELSRTALERASVLAEICRSASLDGSSSHFSSAFKFQDTGNLCKSISDDGHLEHTQFGDANPLNAEVGIHFQSHSSSSDDYKDALDGMPYSVSLAYSGERYGWDSRNQPPSPVGKLWHQFSSHSRSSGKCSTSNPELTCFPIEEDPSSSEENKTMEENAGDTQDETDSSLANNCDKRNPLTDLTNMCTNPPISVSTEEETLRAGSVDFLRSKFSVTGTQEKTLLGQKYQFRKNSEASEKQTSCTRAADGRKHQLSSIGSNATKRANESVYNNISKSVVSTKTRLKGRDQKFSSRGSRSNNIVSNISSFIPLIQQKQAATACQGKRDVKVKALEAAEAAKRVEEQKENERKKRKEALKLERAKLEEKNLKNIELEKKKKEEDRKKKDAEVIAKKRLREEEEKKEKEKKRMRLESRQRQRDQEEKKRVARPEKENQRTKDDQMKRKKEFNNESKKQQNREITVGESVAMQDAGNNLTLNEFVANYEESGTSAICDGEGMHAVDKSPRNEDLIVPNSNGKSYEISPYQCTDDEDEEDDELRNKKRIPSWSSKSSIALFLPMQHQLDPDVIFPLESFCSIGEILLPRKLRQKKVAA
ncbi:uncharacterized protein LOC125223510 [Salvia hispanica]|uniref:uncharacterized protein LOC125223510 n=1 Tax=Salvia hispanica TaxID=49212 RepID=UPI00200948B0|nr:uncharacterized protein LOC125223510 [Salvia hispanica]